MIAEALRLLVHRANRELAESGLVMGTFGNVSGVDRDLGLFVIKPSGVAYQQLLPEEMVAISLATGLPVDSRLRPSSDTPTHLELYRAFDCGGIVHTHSPFATALAQARLPVRCTGTTHADHFRGDVPVTRLLSQEEVGGDYERNTGLAIVETFHAAGLQPGEVPAVLVAHHGPFTWGRDPAEAIEHAQILEYAARIETIVLQLAPSGPRPDAFLVDRHFQRKHGRGAYYGQKQKK